MGRGYVVAYRKAKGSDTWHWCKNCSRWPNTNYDEQQQKPTSGELCYECKGKEAAKTCQK
jgi:hypothetical protein